MGDQVTGCRAVVEEEWEAKCRLDGESSEEPGEETTPTTTASDADSSDIAGDEDLELMAKDDVSEAAEECEEEPEPVAPRQLGPGLFPTSQGGTLPDDDGDDQHEGSGPSRLSSQQMEEQCEELPALTPSAPSQPLVPIAPSPPQETRTASDHEGCATPATSSRDAPASDRAAAGEDHQAVAPEVVRFTAEETVFIFDWDDTVLPSSWIQGQGLRLDEGSSVNAWQREQLTEVATLAAETLRLAKQQGTVVLVTNAERGWIELSCLKFLPTLYPSLENVKILSARTAYECDRNASPLDWKLRAFESEINRIYGSETLTAPFRRKNVLSLGDSVHEREALLRATTSLPNCCAKSLKFCERPDIAQICKQHSLVTSCFERIVHHDGNLDLCIRCA